MGGGRCSSRRSRRRTSSKGGSSWGSTTHPTSGRGDRRVPFGPGRNLPRDDPSIPVVPTPGLLSLSQDTVPRSSEVLEFLHPLRPWVYQALCLREVSDERRGSSSLGARELLTGVNARAKVFTSLLTGPTREDTPCTFFCRLSVRHGTLGGAQGPSDGSG